MLLDAVDYKERQGKILDSEVVSIELHADVIASKESEEWSSALCQVDEGREGKPLDSEVVNIGLPEVYNELPADVIANKKSEEGWSCALCQVTTTSEKDLIGHVHGKKHEAKVAALRAQTTGKNYSIKLVAKKPANSIYVEMEGLKLKAQSLFSEKATEATSKKDDFSSLEKPKSEQLNETQAEVNQLAHKNEDDLRKKVQKNVDPKGCEFWCDICQVRTFSSEVMNAHKLGKKHTSRLRRCEQVGGTGSFNLKKSDVLVDLVEDVSGNGKGIDLGEFKRALDEVSSEDHMVLDTVGDKERQVKTLDSKVVDTELPGVVDIELHADVIGSKKSNEWSCALCQVSVTSEKGLNEHVLGKKHKSKEAAIKSS
ncbi:hypothetical protein F511_21363 [Dorcoceras hygrometricum]|uniref:C2H2-type domain-containing protein n=1 Tax=Dorcoceras hygrometricum TaxID=472368 RepID=A0A2Z7BTC2_9LAMI|nr:hypothetical protein F511_21363 [Dorcoceras hygrometricum]